MEMNLMMTFNDFHFGAYNTLDPVTKYALDILENRIISGKTLKQACQRHIDNFKRQGSEDFPYVFDISIAEDGIFKFVEKYCKFTDGKLAGQPVTLTDFQKFILGSIFSWVHKDTGYRRYTTAYIQIARKNSKTLLVSWVSLYMFMADDYAGSQVYMTASAKEQARISYEECVKTITFSKSLKKRLKIRDSISRIDYKKKFSKLVALASDTKKLDGFNPHCGVIDEYHAHPNNQMYKLIDDGAVQQDEPLIFIITTAGFNLQSPCFEEYEYCKKILDPDNEIVNEKRFVYIAEMDEDDDILDEENWKKSNPLISYLPGGLDKIRQKVQEAIDNPQHMRNMLIKTLNKWVDMKKDGYMETNKWKECAIDRNEFLDIIKGKECYVGVDLSQKHDLSSCAFIFPLEKDLYAIYSHCFIPGERVVHKESTDKAPYRRWIDAGWMSECDGLTIKNKDIEKFIVNFANEHKLEILEIDYDTWNANQFSQNMEELGYTCVEISQGIRTMGEPTKDFRNKVYDKCIIHDGNPVLTWNISNAIEKSDTNGNIKIDKSDRTQKVDSIVAVINGYVRASNHEYNNISVEEFSDEEFLKRLWGNK